MVFDRFSGLHGLGPDDRVVRQVHNVQGRFADSQVIPGTGKQQDRVRHHVFLGHLGLGFRIPGHAGRIIIRIAGHQPLVFPAVRNRHVVRKAPVQVKLPHAGGGKRGECLQLILLVVVEGNPVFGGILDDRVKVGRMPHLPVLMVPAYTGKGVLVGSAVHLFNREIV